MKKIIRITVMVALIFTLNISAYATTGKTIPDGFEYAYEYDGIILGKSVNEMTESEKRQNGLNIQTNTRAINGYAINGTSSSITVYADATGTTSVGTLDPRERVYAHNTFGNRTYIQFVYYGQYKYGYVLTSRLAAPSLGLYRPIREGKISQQWQANGGHTGIDVSTNGAYVNLYTLHSGTYNYRTWHATINGQTMLVNFGNWVKTTFTAANGETIEAVYAHMSSFENGYTASTAPSYRNSYDGTSSTSLGSISLSANTVVGKSGNSGYSTGAHLHFETRLANNISQKRDPFNYVIFPGVGYDTFYAS